VSIISYNKIKFFCHTSSTVSPFSDNIICDASSYDVHYIKFLKIIEGYIKTSWILILVMQMVVF